jgi:hypothetical protein
MSRERPTSAFIGPCIGPSSFAQRGSWWSIRPVQDQLPRWSRSALRLKVPFASRPSRRPLSSALSAAT